MAIINAQKILTGDKTLVDLTSSAGTMTLSNSHASAEVIVDLYMTSQVGTKITDTGVNVNLAAGYGVTTSSQAIVVDGTAATSDMFLSEQVYDVDGALFGTCTVFTDGTHITFGGGLLRTIFNDDSLYTGTRYYILRGVKIPRGASFVLPEDEINFDSSYKMYIDVNVAAGGVDIITRNY